MRYDVSFIVSYWLKIGAFELCFLVAGAIAFPRRDREATGVYFGHPNRNSLADGSPFFTIGRGRGGEEIAHRFEFKAEREFKFERLVDFGFAARLLATEDSEALLR